MFYLNNGKVTNTFKLLVCALTFSYELLRLDIFFPILFNPSHSDLYKIKLFSCSFHSKLFSLFLEISSLINYLIMFYLTFFLYWLSIHMCVSTYIYMNLCMLQSFISSLMRLSSWDFSLWQVDSSKCFKLLLVCLYETQYISFN